jgi:signal transduction histidine kinase
VCHFTIELRIAVTVLGKGFAISVSNRGAPIPAETMPLLFTAFQRGDV